MGKFVDKSEYWRAVLSLRSLAHICMNEACREHCGGETYAAAIGAQCIMEAYTIASHLAETGAGEDCREVLADIRDYELHARAVLSREDLQGERPPLFKPHNPTWYYEGEGEPPELWRYLAIGYPGQNHGI